MPAKNKPARFLKKEDKPAQQMPQEDMLKTIMKTVP
jgi:hypothetical protein